jgi:hypothetical protein
MVDAYMQDDLQEQIAVAEPAPMPPSPDEGAEADPQNSCWGPFLPQVCVTPPASPEEEAAGTPLNEPVAKNAERQRKPKADELPPIDDGAPEEVALQDRVFASIIDSWHGPKACAAAVGDVAGTPTVRMEMDIDGTGRVKDARALDVDGITERELASCLEMRARGLRFPPAEVRRETTRDATFVF